MEWTDEEVDRAVELLTRKIENAPDIDVPGIVATVVCDMALLSQGVLVLDDYDEERNARGFEEPPG